MSKNLLIVESPNKIKSIKKYLGSDFEVLASFGHVRDLVPKNGAVDPEHDFAMKYEVPAKSKKHIDAIVAAAKEADTLYLATDPDREGEAISWHIYEILKTKRGIKNLDERTLRVVFHEVTKKGAPRLGLPGRLQPLPAAVEENPARPERRPRAKPRPAPDLRARKRNPRL